MPELPDVEVYKKYVEKHAMNKKITSIEYNDSKQLLESSKQEISRNVKGAKFTSSKRLGKHLLLQVDDKKWLAMHFGMTGDVKYFKNDEKEPQYSKVIFAFNNDHKLSIISKRKLGALAIAENTESYAKEYDIGIDAWQCSYGDFKEALEGKRGGIKNVLMDQSRVAGIGNIYSDEILYQVKIHPKFKFEKLDEKALKSLYNTIQRVLKTAINHKANPKDFPNHYLLKHRKEGEDCPDCKGKIEKIEINGRGCYICPKCQKL
jgi:formamidopyrimidine-DNA glycosylase